GYQRRMARWWAEDGFDVLVSPVLNGSPPPLGWLTDPEQGMTRVLEMMQYTAQFNITGQPAVSLPLHWTASGLPMGVQFTAAFQGEVPLHGGDLLRRCRAPDRHRTEAHGRAVEGALLHLDHPGRMGHHQLDAPWPGSPPVAALGVEGPAVVGVTGPLRVGQEGLAHVAEGDGLLVVEGLDGRVLPVAPARPGPQQGRQGGHVGMKRGGHASSIAPALVDGRARFDDRWAA